MQLFNKNNFCHFKVKNIKKALGFRIFPRLIKFNREEANQIRGIRLPRIFLLLKMSIDLIMSIIVILP